MNKTKHKNDTRKIKVCLMITKGIWGGAQEYVYTLATSLPQERYDITVLAGEGETLQNKLREKNIKVYTMGSLHRDISFFDEIHSFFELYLFLRKEKPGVLHLNSSKIGFLGGLAGRIVGIRNIVFTAHGWAFNEKRPWLQKKIFLLLHYMTILLSYKTIAVSEKTKKDISWLPYIQDKIEIIYNGISPINFKTREEARTELATILHTDKTTENIIGTISELHTTKGLDFLIKASYTLPPHTSVYIIGSGNEKENLEKLIETYNVSHKVFLLGRVANAREYLKAFDVFTLTSRTEALPYSILEAGLAGLPVVASNVGGIPEIIDNKKNGLLIEMGNGKNLEHTLHTLILNPKKRAELGNNLKEKITRDFNVKEMLQKTEKVYRQKTR